MGADQSIAGSGAGRSIAGSEAGRGIEGSGAVEGSGAGQGIVGLGAGRGTAGLGAGQGIAGSGAGQGIEGWEAEQDRRCMAGEQHLEGSPHRPGMEPEHRTVPWAWLRFEKVLYPPRMLQRWKTSTLLFHEELG